MRSRVASTGADGTVVVGLTKTSPAALVVAVVTVVVKFCPSV